MTTGTETELAKVNALPLVLESVGKEILGEIAGGVVELVGTAARVFEKDGGQAVAATSGWCRVMDAGPSDPGATIRGHDTRGCARAVCRESCWKASKPAIDTKAPVDIDCPGGIRVYTVPIVAAGEVVGAINFGYGDPPKDPHRIAEIAALYGVSTGDLRREADANKPRSEFIIALAKNRLRTAARLVGEIVHRHRIEDAIKNLNAELDDRIRDRTARIEVARENLESFSHSVTYGLRAPLRGMDGFSCILTEQYCRHLPEGARDLLGKIRASVQDMKELIDDLLAFSGIGGQGLRDETVDPAELIEGALAKLAPLMNERHIEWKIGPLPACRGDRKLLGQVFLNLLENAIKFSRDRDPARVEVGARPGASPGEIEYFVKDNGTGFEMRYADKLFGVFQRLHAASEFEGTGIGLSLVRRIIEKHGGRVRAESTAGVGATFSFTLPTGVTA